MKSDADTVTLSEPHGKAMIITYLYCVFVCMGLCVHVLHVYGTLPALESTDTENIILLDDVRGGVRESSSITDSRSSQILVNSSDTSTTDSLLHLSSLSG